MTPEQRAEIRAGIKDWLGIGTVYLTHEDVQGVDLLLDDNEQLERELAEVKAERDRLRGQVERAGALALRWVYYGEPAGDSLSDALDGAEHG